MTYKLILNGAEQHLEFLNKDRKHLNGDIESFDMMFNYFRLNRVLITILVTKKTWVKKTSNFKKNLILLKEKGLIQDFYIIDLINPVHEKIPKNIFQSIKIKFSSLKKQKEYSKEFSKIVNSVNPKFVISFQDSFPNYYKSNVPLIVWGLHNSDHIIKYNLNKKKSYLLSKELLNLKVFFNNFLFKKSVRKVSLNLCPSLYFGSMNEKIFKNKPKVFYFSHPAKDLKKMKPSFQFSSKKIITLIGTTHSTWGKANIDFLLDEILKYHYEELSDFEFHIVGQNKYSKIQNQNSIYKYYNVKLCGFVDDLFYKIVRSDVILHAIKFTPTSGYKLPNICSAHPCLLLHKEAFKGFPELFRNKACLSATSGKDFVRKLKILTTNRSLALKIRKNARKVYDEHYSLNNFSKIMKKCEKQYANFIRD